MDQMTLYIAYYLTVRFWHTWEMIGFHTWHPVVISTEMSYQVFWRLRQLCQMIFLLFKKNVLILSNWYVFYSKWMFCLGYNCILFKVLLLHNFGSIYTFMNDLNQLNMLLKCISCPGVLIFDCKINIPVFLYCTIFKIQFAIYFFNVSLFFKKLKRQFEDNLRLLINKKRIKK